MRHTQDSAADFEELFHAIYVAFHRRDGKRSALSGASRAVLNHLSLSGPLTIGEAARHLDRAQSVVSDIVSQLERNGLLERERDPADQRRTLVWLTPTGIARLATDRQVLSTDLLARAMATLSGTERAALFDGARALLDGARRLRADGTGPTSLPHPTSRPEQES